MKENNLETLRRAIAQLPEYEAPSKIWKQVEQDLEIALQEQPLTSAVEELPVYEAPSSLWDNISAELDQGRVETTKKPRIFQLRRMAAAAAIALLVSAGAWFMSNQYGARESVSMAYSEETVNAALLEVDWEEDETAFAMVAELCKQAVYACQQPEFQILQAELEALNEARISLKEAMEAYGKDAELIAQLTEIEYERSDLLKQLIAKI